MYKESFVSLLLAFSLGVLLTLLLALRFNDARYIPFGSDGNRILDTRNGRAYSRAAEGKVWLLKVQKVGK